MPWELEREAETLHVRIAAPVEDWDDLLGAVNDQLVHVPLVVTLPEDIPGGDEADDEKLTSLRDALATAGVNLRGEPDDPVGTERPRQD